MSFACYSPELEFTKLISGVAYNLQNGNENCSVGGGAVTGAAGGCEWRITTVNKDFSVCPTYGTALIVPKSITDEQIVQSAAFRDGGRFPVLSYRHENGVSG